MTEKHEKTHENRRKKKYEEDNKEGGKWGKCLDSRGVIKYKKKREKRK